MHNLKLNYIWKCAKCSSHFSNILEIEGAVKLEKKCPKCKWLNELSLTENSIDLHCKFDTEDSFNKNNIVKIN